MSPSVSIVTPTYNSNAFLEETIGSVRSQSFRDWELLIVDDASTDDSYKIARKEAERDRRIRPIRLKQNAGAAVARNCGIRSSQGRYIAFLDSDDRWMPEKLSAQIDFMRSRNAAFSYTGYYRINERGERIGQVSVPETVSYHQLLRTCVVGCLTAVYDTTVFGKVEMPLIRKRQDYGLWLELLRRSELAHGLNEPLADYRVRRDSISSNKLGAARYTWKLYREVENLPLTAALYFFSNYAVRGVFRTYAPALFMETDRAGARRD